MSKMRKLLLVLAALLVLAQLVPVDRDQPPVQQEPAMTTEVRKILERSCYDCHSNQTRWPWYSHIAPGSWFIAHHVDEGREHLNFSEWNKLNSRKQAKVLDEVAETVSEGEMPLASYVLGHPEAALSDADQAVLRQWAESASERQAVGRSQNDDEKDAD